MQPFRARRPKVTLVCATCGAYSRMYCCPVHREVICTGCYRRDEHQRPEGWPEGGDPGIEKDLADEIPQWN